MSLLMDALKRAEKARQEERLPGAERPAAERLRAETLGRTQALGNSRVTGVMDDISASELRLEDTDFAPPPPPRAEEDLHREREVAPEPDDSYAHSIPSEGVRRHDESSPTMPSLKGLRDSVDHYFDDTRAGGTGGTTAKRVRMETEPTAAGFERPDLSGLERSPRAAQAVLQAKDLPRTGNTGRRFAIAVLSMLLLAALAVGAYYIWTETMLDRPQIAKRQVPPPAPRAGASQRDVAPSASAEAASERAAAQSDVARVTDLPGAQDAVIAATPASDAVESGVGAEGGTAPDPATSDVAATRLPSLAQAESALAAAAESGERQASSTTSEQSEQDPGAASDGSDATDSLAARASAALSQQPPPRAALEASSQAPSRAGSPDASESAARAQGAGPAAPAEPKASGAAGTSVDSGDALSTRLDRAIDRAGLRPQGAMGDGGIKISKRTSDNGVHRLLSGAYDAFQRGDYQTARSAYRRVLTREPRNRDAYLGLAAIAMRSGDARTAANLYADVLRRNPQDGAAQAGIISLRRNQDPVRGESQIKQLLNTRPNSAPLHFSLGNLYARQARWSQAQEAYFNAFRFDSENPDFAYNLAVSLDQLGQGDAARKYYIQALDLAAGRIPRFDANAVEVRIQSLGAGLAR